MIAKRIERSLDPASLKTLNTDKRKFQWVATNGTIYNDGPTMLFLLMSKVNPSVRVGIAALKMNIQTATLPKFNHNLPKMVEYIQENYSQIVLKKGSHDDLTLHTFNALETTNNAEFKQFVQEKKDAWETSPFDRNDDANFAENLMEKTVAKYNNMSLAKNWKKTEDPSSKIVSALVTKVSSLEKLLEEKNGGATALATSSEKPKLAFPEWRTKKGKDSVNRDGKQWWWCPHHKKEGLFDGLYMTHKPCDHDEWLEKKKERRQKAKEMKKQSGGGNSKNKNKKLTLTDSMKQALMTNANMTEEQAKACWAACTSEK